MKNHTYRRYIIFAVFLILITGILLIFSTTTSPLYPNYYFYDSAFYRFIGRQILKGKTLYKDIWDNKGPLLFFIQALGTINGTKNTAANFTFLLQVISLCAAVFLIAQTDRLLIPERKKRIPFIIPFICFSAIFCKTMEFGNMSEEWSLPFICCSLYLMIKYTAGTEKSIFHPYRYAFIHGICFAAIAFIRLNNAISICSGLLVIGIWLVMKRQWKNLFQNILFGFLGFMLIMVPVCAYFLRKNALQDMIYAIFLYNLKYAGQSAHRNFSVTELLLRYLTIAVSALIIAFHTLRNRRIKLTDVLLSGITAANWILLLKTNIYLHYFTIFLPVFLIILLVYADDFSILEIILTFGVLSFFIVQDIRMAPDLDYMHNIEPQFSTAENIPRDERVSAIAFNVMPEIYLNTGIEPCSRFAAYQYIHFPIDPEFAEEFINSVQTIQPIWIIRPCRDTYDFPELQKILDEGYHYEFNDPLACYYRQNRE